MTNLCLHWMSLRNPLSSISLFGHFPFCFLLSTPFISHLLLRSHFCPCSNIRLIFIAMVTEKMVNAQLFNSFAVEKHLEYLKCKQGSKYYLEETEISVQRCSEKIYC